MAKQTIFNDPFFDFLKIKFQSVAEPTSVVIGPGVRFTVLADRLIRMECVLVANEKIDQFLDVPSQAFWYRKQAVPSFVTSSNNEEITIETEYLLLKYEINNSGFSPKSLSVLIKSTNETWHYGDHPFYQGGNLGGTFRTLDEVSGSVLPDPGLISKKGWAIVDDSNSLIFDDRGWLQQRQNLGNVDLYFFGYGHDYRSCLRDFHKIAGKVPVIPRWALGNWWSRYWDYSSDELLSLINDFKKNEIPLAVCIVDMDWHITDTGNASGGWTGYTWNRELFPDPPLFIEKIHQHGLKTALNLHPAAGVWPHEEQYREFSENLGKNPESKEPILFDCADPVFIKLYFELLHYPREAEGIDFWWMDWQQGTQSTVSGLDPLWWLNHLHFLNLGRNEQKRSFIFSRWGGLGNHRYPIGFSGDTVINWDVLSFLPGFTSTAANVGYGWWSHDIGGHMGGIEDDELYTRWVQFGCFSPILRLHSTKNPFHERRPWGRTPSAAQAASNAMRLRHTLIPYLYSMAWRNHIEDIPLITPIYYSHPEQTNAYECLQQYWFGSELIAAPFTRPANNETRLSKQTVWLPPGDWFSFFTGEFHQGGRWLSIYGTLEDIPVFAKAGAIVPLAPEVDWGGLHNPEEIHTHIYPGADNRFVLYEDDGESTKYINGERIITEFSLNWDEDYVELTVSSSGDLTQFKPNRMHYFYFHGIKIPERTIGMITGLSFELSTFYDTDLQTLGIGPLKIGFPDELSIKIFGNDLVIKIPRTKLKIKEYLASFRLDSWVKKRIYDLWPKIETGEVDLLQFKELSDAQVNILQELIEGKI